MTSSKIFTVAATKSDKAVTFTCPWGWFDFCMLEQDSAPAHRACKMVEFLARDTPDFIPHVAQS